MERKKFHKKRFDKSEASATAVIYKGPVISKQDKTQVQMTTTLSHADYTVTTTAGSVVAFVYPVSNPSSSSVWTDLAGAWDEFRVIASMYEFCPATSAAGVTTIGAVLQHAIDRDTSAVPASYAALDNYESVKYSPVDRPTKLTWKMTGTDEAVWQNTSSPVTTGTFKLFGICANYVSSVVGHVRMSYRIQLRGRGL